MYQVRLVNREKAMTKFCEMYISNYKKFIFLAIKYKLITKIPFLETKINSHNKPLVNMFNDQTYIITKYQSFITIFHLILKISSLNRTFLK